VLFVVDRLERLTGDSRGVRQAVETLLQIGLALGLEYDSTSEIRAGSETGVWTEKGKFASVGVAIENRVLLHGLSVNGFRTPVSFLGIRPCGLAPRLDFLLDCELDCELELGFSEMGRRLLDLALENFWPACHGALDAESLPG
jgi:lipoate-protein ligase B